jgi:hypothetical protein
VPDQQQQQAEIIHLGNVCQQCGEQWKAFYEDASILAPMVAEYNEVPVDGCEECEGEDYPAGTDGTGTGQAGA